MTAPTILVAGLGRCGSSLVMQMLNAGGVPTIGLYPAFEDESEVALRGDPAAWHALTAGKAVKILDPHLTPPPAAGSYRTILLTRSIEEQAKSMLKFAGAPASRHDRRAMEALLRRELDQARKALTGIGTGMYFSIPFEDLITEPLKTAFAIAGFVTTYWTQPLDPGAMAACVRDRAPECLPYLLEPELLASCSALPPNWSPNNTHGEKV